MAKKKPHPHKLVGTKPWGMYAKEDVSIADRLEKHFGRGKRKPGQRAPGPKKTPGKNIMTPMARKKKRDESYGKYGKRKTDWSNHQKG